MADVTDTVPFKALVTQISAVLLTRGLHVETVAVRGVAARLVESVAARVGLDAEEAVPLVTPEMVADLIVAAADPSAQGAERVHAARPVRVDSRRVVVPVGTLGRLVITAAQTGKYAVLNGHGRVAEQAMDLATELGNAIRIGGEAGEGEVPVGALDELADLAERSATRIEEGEWSICPCGEQHEQDELDAKVAAVWRRDAALARELRG
jgi:hypothetical protein